MWWIFEAPNYKDFSAHKDGRLLPNSIVPKTLKTPLQYGLAQSTRLKHT